MIRDRPKMTVSFTVTPYYAALLTAAYDILMHSDLTNNDWHDIASQTLDNYDALLGELLDRSVSLAQVADDYAPSIAMSIRKYVNIREGD